MMARGGSCHFLTEPDKSFPFMVDRKFDVPSNLSRHTGIKTLVPRGKTSEEGTVAKASENRGCRAYILSPFGNPRVRFMFVKNINDIQ